jgi:hypothetical protein
VKTSVACDAKTQPTLARYASRMADGVAGVAKRLREGSIEDLTRDARSLAQRNPGMFLLSGAALGIVVARFFRASADRPTGVQENAGQEEDYDAGSKNQEDAEIAGEPNPTDDGDVVTAAVRSGSTDAEDSEGMPAQAAEVAGRFSDSHSSGSAAGEQRLPEDVDQSFRPRRLKDALQGSNSKSEQGYLGPRPTPGDPAHHYHFQVFALDTELDLPRGFNRHALLTAMKGHVLASGELVGTFQQPE